MTLAVAIKKLKKSYGQTAAVKDISFTVAAAEIFGLLGPNGAGKTTTIRCLCTLAKPDGGKIEVGGVDALNNPKSARKRLGYVAQEVALDKMLTGRELLQLQAALYHIPPQKSRERIKELINLLGLEEYADKKTGTYSGGIKKRLDLAAGLLHQPEVLVLDEPTVGLDIESRLIVWDFLRQLRAAGTSVLITSHYLEEIDALADNLAIIDNGIVIARGTPSQLKEQLGGDRTANSNPLSKIEQTLAESGLPVFSMAQSRPSLDDVYLAATGRTLMDAEIAAASSRDLKAEKKQAMKES